MEKQSTSYDSAGRSRSPARFKHGGNANGASHLTDRSDPRERCGRIHRRLARPLSAGERLHEPSRGRHQADPRVASGASGRRQPCRRSPVARGVQRRRAHGVAHIYNLACDMGGMGFIEANKAACMISVLINTHLLLAAKEAGVQRYFYSLVGVRLQRGAPAGRRRDRPARGRRLSGDARGRVRLGEALLGAHVPALPRRLRHRDARRPIPQRLRTRTARYGRGPRKGAGRDLPQGRRSQRSSASNEIEIWGDGEQTRSFMYIDDCLLGTMMIMESDILDPINLGSSELVTINQLVDIVEEIAGVSLRRRYDLDAPERSTRAQLGQHAHPGTSRLGAEHASLGRAREDVRLDLRRADDCVSRRSPSRRIPLMRRRARRVAAGP